VDQKIAVIGEDPFRLVIAFHAVGQFSGLLFELEAYLVRDGLDLPLIVSGADDEIVSKAGDAGEVKNFDIGRLLRFGGPDCDEPGGGCGFGRVGCLRIRFGQIIRTPVRIVLQGHRPDRGSVRGRIRD
jgi:hypothetical protein